MHRLIFQAISVNYVIKENKRLVMKKKRVTQITHVSYPDKTKISSAKREPIVMSK